MSLLAVGKKCGEQRETPDEGFTTLSDVRIINPDFVDIVLKSIKNSISHNTLFHIVLPHWEI